METRVQWNDAEQTVLLIGYQPGHADPTISEQLVDIQKAFQMISTVDHPVALLIDFRYSRTIPKGNWLAASRAFTNNLPPNLGLVVIVGSRLPSFFLGIANIFKRLSRDTFDVVFVQTLEESETVFSEWRARQSQPAS